MKKTVGLLRHRRFFMVFELPCAGMKIGCHGYVDRAVDGKYVITGVHCI